MKTKRRKKAAPDVLVRREGHTMFLFAPQTDAAREWLDAHTDGTWWCGMLAVDHRYVDALALAMQRKGFKVAS